MTSSERKELRYYRRKEARQKRKQNRADKIGSLDFIFSFHNLFKYGLDSCKNVRWKCSVQEFEMTLFSGTAKRRRDIINNEWHPDNYVHFLINERGKTRPIDAPRIQDRQINKVYTKEILLPLYLPDMIYNNGASLEGKGYKFSQDQLVKDLRHHFNLYGREGKIILLDFHHFFPLADHQIIYNRHKKLILNQELCNLGNYIISCSPKPIGLPLGIETSQAEMIAYPTPLDNYIKCQLGIKGMGHYMDDYYMLIPPGIDAKYILSQVQNKAKELNLQINHSKTQIKSLTKRFRYCKTQYSITETGKIYKHGNKTTLTRDLHKLRHYSDKIYNNQMTYEELYMSVSAMSAYIENYDDHNKLLKFRTLFSLLFGFYPNKIEDFRKNENVNTYF